MWAALEPEDLGSTALHANPKYLYRGQSQWFDRQWPPKDETISSTSISQHSYTIDSLIPTDYRGYEEAIAPQQHTAQNVNIAYSTEVTHLRAWITYVAVDRWINGYESISGSPFPQEVTAWVQSLDTPDPGNMSFDRLGSIGQHCELPSGYTDATSSKHVALWFASHRWDDGSYISRGQGFIYRIDYDVLCQIEAELNTLFNLSGTARYRHVDIRQTPQAVCPRPALQNGWSLINFESPWLLLELIQRGAIEMFRFTRGNHPSHVNTLSKQADIAPELDGVKEAIAWLHNNPTNANLRDIIDAHSSNPNDCHQLLSQPAAVDIIFRGLQPVV